jgi:capsular polysaccharide export protein
MVTVNSTSGIQALLHGRPVKTLGEAIYDMRGLTFQDALDQFWTQAAMPDRKLVQAFINAMAVTIQIRGVFFAESGRKAAAGEAAQRLSQGIVGTVLTRRQM